MVNGEAGSELDGAAQRLQTVWHLLAVAGRAGTRDGAQPGDCGHLKLNAAGTFQALLTMLPCFI